MKAIVKDLRRVVEEHQRQTCAKHDLLIHTSAVAETANTGRGGEAKLQSILPGSPFTGVVVEVGEAVAGFAPGDRVCGITRQRMLHDALNVLSEVEARQLVVKLPKTVDNDTAMALPVAGLTASACVNRLDEYHEQCILVVGVTGPIGQFTAQLANMRGAVVIGVGEGAALSNLSRVGVTALIDLNRADFGAAATDVWKRFGNNFDVVIDVTGEANHVREFGRLVRPGGRYLSMNTAVTTADLHDFDVAVMTITFDDGLAGLQAELERLVNFVAAKKLKVPELAAK